MHVQTQEKEKQPMSAAAVEPGAHPVVVHLVDTEEESMSQYLKNFARGTTKTTKKAAKKAAKKSQGFWSWCWNKVKSAAKWCWDKITGAARWVKDKSIKTARWVRTKTSTGWSWVRAKVPAGARAVGRVAVKPFTLPLAFLPGLIWPTPILIGAGLGAAALGWFMLSSDSKKKKGKKGKKKHPNGDGPQTASAAGEVPPAPPLTETQSATVRSLFDGAEGDMAVLFNSRDKKAVSRAAGRLEVIRARVSEDMRSTNALLDNMKKRESASMGPDVVKNTFDWGEVRRGMQSMEAEYLKVAQPEDSAAVDAALEAPEPEKKPTRSRARKTAASPEPATA